MILFNDKAIPSPPIPNPIYLGKKGSRKTKRKNANLSLWNIMKKYALTTIVKTAPNNYPLEAKYLCTLVIPCTKKGNFLK